MSYSLQLKAGDLSPSGGQVATVQGVQKTVQDLRVALLEPRGSDPLHPDFGSLLNGGIDEIGRTQPGVIGSTINNEVLLGIESEIRRVINLKIVDQQSQLFTETNVFGGMSTFLPDELIQTIASLDTTTVGDVAVVSVTLAMADNATLQIVAPISSG